MKVYSSNLTHFQYLMIVNHYRGPQGTRYSHRNKCIIHLFLVSAKEGPESYRFNPQLTRKSNQQLNSTPLASDS